MEKKTYIVVKNFSENQHYSDRNPLWIKLYIKLLRSEKFFNIKETERWVYVGLLLLAGAKNNKIPYEKNYLKANIFHYDFPIENIEKTIQVLVDNDLVAINLLSECYQPAISRREEKRREEKRREENIYSSINFLKNLPTNEIKELADKYSVTNSFITKRADEAVNWLEAKGRVYKNYKAGLRIFITKHIEAHPDCIVVKRESPKIEVDTRTSEEKAKDRARRELILEQSKKIIKKL